jgi:Holliday junction resolvase RusA-like endonuclease
MTELRLIIPGAPTGKGRPRFVRSTGHAHTPTATRTAEARVANAWENAGAIRLPDGPLSCRIEAVVARPGSHWRVNGTLSAAGQRSLWPTKKPDLDNIIKLVGDSLNNLAYRDDADIVQVCAVRRWCNPGERDHTLIVLRPILNAAMEIAA